MTWISRPSIRPIGSLHIPLLHVMAPIRNLFHLRSDTPERVLHFICYSVDLLSDYESMPALSFQPKLSERDRFYELLSSDERLSVHDLHDRSVVSEVSVEEQCGDFIQGVDNNNYIFTLSPLQTRRLELEARSSSSSYVVVVLQ